MKQQLKPYSHLPCVENETERGSCIGECGECRCCLKEESEREKDFLGEWKRDNRCREDLMSNFCCCGCVCRRSCLVCGELQPHLVTKISEKGNRAKGWEKVQGDQEREKKEKIESLQGWLESLMNCTNILEKLKEKVKIIGSEVDSEYETENEEAMSEEGEGTETEREKTEKEEKETEQEKKERPLQLWEDLIELILSFFGWCVLFSSLSFYIHWRPQPSFFSFY